MSKKVTIQVPEELVREAMNLYRSDADKVNYYRHLINQYVQEQVRERLKHLDLDAIIDEQMSQIDWTQVVRDRLQAYGEWG